MKILVAIIFTFMTMCNALAQKSIGFGFRIGTGVNERLSMVYEFNMGCDVYYGKSYSNNVAFLAEIGVNNGLTLVPELQYISKGCSMLGGGVDSKANAKYLGFNVLPKFQFGIKSFKVFSLLGPSMNVKLPIGVDSYQLPDYDVSAVVGAGTSYQLARSKFFLELRYNYPLISFHDTKFTQVAYNIGYVYLLKK